MIQILEADLLQVAMVMGLDDEMDVTDDIGMADAILACSAEMKENPWIRSVAKFHQLPVFVIKVYNNHSLLQQHFCCMLLNKKLFLWYFSQIPWPRWSRQSV